MIHNTIAVMNENGDIQAFTLTPNVIEEIELLGDAIMEDDIEKLKKCDLNREEVMGVLGIWCHPITLAMQSNAKRAFVYLLENVPAFSDATFYGRTIALAVESGSIDFIPLLLGVAKFSVEDCTTIIDYIWHTIKDRDMGVRILNILHNKYGGHIPLNMCQCDINKGAVKYLRDYSAELEMNKRINFHITSIVMSCTDKFLIDLDVLPLIAREIFKI